MWLVSLGIFTSCSRDPSPPPPAEIAPRGAPASIVRISAEEWRNSVEDLLGVRWYGALPTDYRLSDHARIGGSELSIPPLDLDLYETAIWSVATSVLRDETSVGEMLGCDAADPSCVRAFAARFGRSAWRRPLSTVELDRLLALQSSVAEEQGSVLGATALVAALLLSPEFLFRVEIGLPQEDGSLRLSPHELAGRLASFLTASVPDDALLDAADAGQLGSRREIRAQAERLLDSPRGQAAMLAYLEELFELHEMDIVEKDPALYPPWTTSLQQEMLTEMRALFSHVLSPDRPLDSLLLSRVTDLGPELIDLYRIETSESKLSSLPDGSIRGGALGRSAFLTIQSHNETTSPTYRGKFISSKLLCEIVPPPPDGVVFDIDISLGGTTRDRLEQHATDPACSGCHMVIDPPGYGLEHFDPIGRYRDLDNGLPIDATGEIDGVPFDGALSLSSVIASDERFPACAASRLLRYAAARPALVGEESAVAEIVSGRGAAELTLREIVLDIAVNPLFRELSPPVGGSCEGEGLTRTCSSPCGLGVERCEDGRWQGCTAPATPLETCNGLDDDCDGEIDEAVERSCELGTEVCEGGAYLPCEGPSERLEVCNGVDDDTDGGIDEGYGLVVRTFSIAELSLLQPDCDLSVDPGDLSCGAGMEQLCEGTSCAVAGVGPISMNTSEIEMACLSEAEAVRVPVNFDILHALDRDCEPDTFFAYCFPAAHLYCEQLGLVTGYGVARAEDGSLSVVCTPNATLMETSYETLHDFDLSCDGRDFGAHTEIGCLHAIHELCVSEGFEAGYGLQVRDQDHPMIACLGDGR